MNTRPPLTACVTRYTPSGPPILTVQRDRPSSRRSANTTVPEITTPDLSRVPRPLATGLTYSLPYLASVMQGNSRRHRKRRRSVYASIDNAPPPRQSSSSIEGPRVIETQFTTSRSTPTDAQMIEVDRHAHPRAYFRTGPCRWQRQRVESGPKRHLHRCVAALERTGTV